jgi:hypothetical protein
MTYGAKQIHGPEKRVISIAQGVKNANGGWCPFSRLKAVAFAVYTLSAAGRKGFLSENGREGPRMEVISMGDSELATTRSRAGDLDEALMVLTVDILVVGKLC